MHILYILHHHVHVERALRLTMTVSVTVTQRLYVATQRLTYTGLSQNQVGGH